MAIYAMLMRPPEPGAIPRAWLKAVRADNGWLLDEKGEITHHFWGLVEYYGKLTAEETRHYDMRRVLGNVCIIREVREGMCLDDLYAT